MAVPKRKVSKSRRDMRSAHKALKRKNIFFLDGKPQLSHMTILPARERKTKEDSSNNN